MKKGKVYISGPITSIGEAVARNRFGFAETVLHYMGYRTCNPMKMRLCVFLARHGHYRICLLLQLAWMWMTCDRIYLLDEWHTSDGARLERAAARVLGITVMYQSKGKNKQKGK
jgi:hypothetical protein